MDIPQHERGTLSLEAHTHEAKLAFHHVCRRQMDKMDSIGHAATMDGMDSMDSKDLRGLCWSVWTSRNMNVEFCFCEARTHEIKLAFHHVRQLDKQGGLHRPRSSHGGHGLHGQQGLTWTVLDCMDIPQHERGTLLRGAHTHTHTRSKAVIPSCLPSTDGQDGQLPSTDGQGGLLRPRNNHGQHGLRGQQGPTRTSAT